MARPAAPESRAWYKKQWQVASYKWQESKLTTDFSGTNSPGANLDRSVATGPSRRGGEGELQGWSEQKKGVALGATPEPPLGGWRSHYPAPERRKEIFQLPVLRLANSGPIARKLADKVYNNYLIFKPVVNMSCGQFYEKSKN